MTEPTMQSRQAVGEQRRGTSRRTVTFFSWEGDRRPSESNGNLPLQDDLKSHLQADCLYTGISSGKVR